MTANAVIEEIKQMPRTEQSRVIQFACELARQRQLDGKELASLAQQMADSRDPAEIKNCGKKFIAVFTANSHATHSASRSSAPVVGSFARSCK